MRIPNFGKTIKNLYIHIFIGKILATWLGPPSAKSKLKGIFYREKILVFSKESLKSVLTIPVGDLKEEYF